MAAAPLTPFTHLYAAEVDGVTMPDTRTVDGMPMRLNGIGLRTFSILGIPVYVAGLYLERRSDNPDAILRSPERKLLDIRFLRDVDAENARKAWRDGFADKCGESSGIHIRDHARNDVAGQVVGWRADQYRQ